MCKKQCRNEVKYGKNELKRVVDNFSIGIILGILTGRVKIVQADMASAQVLMDEQTQKVLK